MSKNWIFQKNIGLELNFTYEFEVFFKKKVGRPIYVGHFYSTSLLNRQVESKRCDVGLFVCLWHHLHYGVCISNVV